MSIPQLNDDRLIQIVDAAIVEATRRSGRHLACKPGCSQCCTGAFAINALDVLRLRQGYLQLQESDPARAERLKERIKSSLVQNASEFPGDPESGSLVGAELKMDYLNDEVCPVLDPETQQCDLYEFRPMMCRVFGPPIPGETMLPDGSIGTGLAVCELCFVDASPEEISACQMVPDPDGIEQLLLQELTQTGDLISQDGQTTVTFAFAEWWMRR